MANHKIGSGVKIMNGPLALSAGMRAGEPIRQANVMNDVNAFREKGDLAGAYKAAQAGRMPGAANDLQQRMDAQDSQQREAAQRRAGQIGSVAYATLRVPNVQDRPQAAFDGLVNAGWDPQEAQMLVAQKKDWSDAGLQATAAQTLTLAEQLAQTSTETTTINDEVVGMKTDNISGAVNAWNAHTAAPAYTDVTTRENNAAQNELAVRAQGETERSNLAGERHRATELSQTGQKNAWDAEAARIEAQRPQRSNVSTSVTMGVDANGDPVPMQASNDGTMVRTQLPDGVSLPPKDSGAVNALPVPRPKTPIGPTSRTAPTPAPQTQSRQASIDPATATAGTLVYPDKRPSAEYPEGSILQSRDGILFLMTAQGLVKQ